MITVGVCAAEKYTMVSIPKLRAHWFNQLAKGLNKASADFVIEVYQQAPSSAHEVE